VADEEGFDFAQYEGGIRWHALACYTRNVETEGFTIFPHKPCFPTILIPMISVARRSTSGVAPFGNFCGNRQAGMRLSDREVSVVPSLKLEALRPLLCAVVNCEDYDVSSIDGISGDEGRIGNNQLTGAKNTASFTSHGEGGKPLNGSKNLHCNPGGNYLVIGESNVVMSLIQLLGRLLGPFDH
jgi:hypothetical protein